MSGLHCTEPYAAQQVALHLDKCLKQGVRRVHYAMYRTKEFHGVTDTDAARVLGTGREHPFPEIPVTPSSLRWTRAHGLVKLQEALDAGACGVVSERGGRRRVKLGGEERCSFKYRADWRPLFAFLTRDGTVGLRYVARFAGVSHGMVNRLLRPGAEPLLGTAERLLLLRALIESRVLREWGERPESRERSGIAKPEGHLILDSPEHPLEALSANVAATLTPTSPTNALEPHRLTPAQAARA